MPDGWTLAAWIEHARAVHELDGRVRDADREALRAEVGHLKEMSALQKEMNDVHFAQLNENALRTIEERGHFVSKDAFEPFKEAVLKYMATNQGQRAGISGTVSWTIAIVGSAMGVAGVIVAIIALVGGP